MISTLASLTFRALLNRRRTLLLGLLGGLIVVVAVVYRLSASTDAEALDFTGRLLANFGVAVLLPLVAVIVGTAALGSELDDGTIVYLLAKPIPRSVIVFVKLAVAWLVTALLVTLPILLAGVIGSGGDPGLGIGYGLAALLGALEYTSVFLALSLVTSRALVIGLTYVVVWEGVVAGLFAGTRIVSIRQHVLTVADALTGEGGVASELDLRTGLLVGGIVTIAAIVMAMRRLSTVELRGETS
jgi:ABC-2 type transport system permease protein